MYKLNAEIIKDCNFWYNWNFFYRANKDKIREGVIAIEIKVKMKRKYAIIDKKLVFWLCSVIHKDQTELEICSSE